MARCTARSSLRKVTLLDFMQSLKPLLYSACCIAFISEIVVSYRFKWRQLTHHFSRVCVCVCVCVCVRVRVIISCNLCVWVFGNSVASLIPCTCDSPVMLDTFVDLHLACLPACLPVCLWSQGGRSSVRRSSSLGNAAYLRRWMHHRERWRRYRKSL